MKKILLIILVGIFILSCGEENKTPDATDKCSNTGEKRCRGAKLDICNNSKWELKEDCTSENKICDSNKLICIIGSETCSKGATRCNSNKLEICNPQHKWEQLKDCNKSGEVCNATNLACEQDDCTAGDARCVNNKLELCDTHKGWTQFLDCTQHSKTCNVDTRECD